jgi:hypothetical protein
MSFMENGITHSNKEYGELIELFCDESLAKNLTPIGEEFRCFGVPKHYISGRISTELLRPRFTRPSHRPEQPAVLTAARTSKSFTSLGKRPIIVAAANSGCMPLNPGQPASRNR